MRDVPPSLQTAVARQDGDDDFFDPDVNASKLSLEAHSTKCATRAEVKPDGKSGSHSSLKPLSDKLVETSASN